MGRSMPRGAPYPYPKVGNSGATDGSRDGGKATPRSHPCATRSLQSAAARGGGEVRARQSGYAGSGPREHHPLETATRVERTTRPGCVVRDPRGAVGGRSVGDGGAHRRRRPSAPELAILRHHNPGPPDGDLPGGLRARILKIPNPPCFGLSDPDPPTGLAGESRRGCGGLHGGRLRGNRHGLRSGRRHEGPRLVAPKDGY